MAVHTPMIGSEIHTSDGDRIGEVKEIRGDFFKVEASMQPDYWLDTSCIMTVVGTDVRLSFDKEHLGDYKRKEPAH